MDFPGFSLIRSLDHVGGSLFMFSDLLRYMVLSASGCYMLYRGSMVVGRKYFPTYHLLSHKNKLEFGMRVVALANAILGSVVGNLYMFGNYDILKKPITGIEYGLDVGLAVHAGYFLYDFVLNSFHHKLMQKHDVLVHHFIVLATIFSYLSVHFASLMVTACLATELSDVFNHCRWLFVQAKVQPRTSPRTESSEKTARPTSRLANVCLLLQFVSHVVFRVFIQVVMLYIAASNGFWAEMHFHSVLLSTTWGVFWFLNLLWAVQMSKVVMAAFVTKSGRLSDAVPERKQRVVKMQVGDNHHVTETSVCSAEVKALTATKVLDEHDESVSDGLPSVDSTDSLDDNKTPETPVRARSSTKGASSELSTLQRIRAGFSKVLRASYSHIDTRTADVKSRRSWMQLPQWNTVFIRRRTPPPTVATE